MEKLNCLWETVLHSGAELASSFGEQPLAITKIAKTENNRKAFWNDNWHLFFILLQEYIGNKPKEYIPRKNWSYIAG